MIYVNIFFWLRNYGTSIANLSLNMSQPEQLVWAKRFKWNGRDALGRKLAWNGTYYTERPNMAIHVSLGFAKLTDKELLPFTAGVVTGLTNNADFPEPPITATVLDGHRKAFEDALAKAFKGSVADTAAKSEARSVVIDDLRQDALYVESTAAGVASKIDATGFQSMSHNHHPQAIMPKVVIKALFVKATGVLEARVEAIDNAHGFQGQVKNGDGAWQDAAASSSSRSILFPDLTPGTFYNVRIRAIGAGGTFGDWSNPQGIICT